MSTERGMRRRDVVSGGNGEAGEIRGPDRPHGRRGMIDPRSGVFEQVYQEHVAAVRSYRALLERTLAEAS